MAGNVGVILVYQGHVHVTDSFSHHIHSTKELMAAAPRGRDVAGNQGHDGRRCWEGRHCPFWERGLHTAGLLS